MQRRIASSDHLPPFARSLQDRLRELDGHAAAIHVELARIDEERGLIQKLFDIERRRATPEAPQQRPEISDIIAAILVSEPATKRALNDAAIRAGHQSPARAIHAILMNYVRHGLVAKSGDDEYALTERGRKTLGGGTEGFE